MRWSFVITFVGVLGLLGLAPASQASHDLNIEGKKGTDAPDPSHELLPDSVPEFPQADVIGMCNVDGSLNIGNKSGNGGIGAVGVSNKSHNHYRFSDAKLGCFAPGTPFNTTFAVEAAGGTDGPRTPGDDNHGEGNTHGWSHSSCYDDDEDTKYQGSNADDPHPCDPPAQNKKGAIEDLYDGDNNLGPAPNFCNNCGEIEVVGANGTESLDRRNVVMFCRGAILQATASGTAECLSTSSSQVIAWGVLHRTDDSSGAPLCFRAVLELSPTNGSGGLLGGKKFDQADLAGNAFLRETTDKSDCFGTLRGKDPVG